VTAIERRLQGLAIFDDFLNNFFSCFAFVRFINSAVSSKRHQLFVAYVTRIIVSKGGEVVHQNVENFDQLLDYDITVNCCGIETKKLLDDDKLVPDRGQVLVFSAD